MSARYVATTARGVRWAVVLAVAACLLEAPRAMAQDRDREIEFAREKIHALLRNAEALEAAGRTEAAHEMYNEAEALQHRLERHLGEHRPPRDHHLLEILEGLEHGLAALERLGRHEEHEILQRVANGVRRELEPQRRVQRNHPEREVAERQIEVLKLALAALREGGRPHSAELVELAIRAREVGLEGRRDEEARTIRRRAPNRAQTIELLMLAEELYREFDLEEEAATISRLTEELWSDRGRRRAQRERPHGLHQLKVMKSARHALLEAGRKDAAELLERAIVAREVGVTDEPPPGEAQVVEILLLAEGLWREFGHPEKAEAVRQVAENMWSGHDRRGEAAERRTKAMRLAIPALVEADRRDLAALLERAIVAREVGVVREPQPGTGQVVEILHVAARLSREFGNLERAQFIGEVAEELWADHERARGPRREARRDGERDRQHRIKMLEARVAELQETIEALIEELSGAGEEQR